VHCTYLAVPSTVNSYAVSSMVINWTFFALSCYNIVSAHRPN
jgi:hypothetical protein